MRIRGTREDALNLPTYRCITISLNLDAESISVLPDMGASHWEKMLVLDCEQPSAEFARKDGTGGMRKWRHNCPPCFTGSCTSTKFRKLFRISRVDTVYATQTLSGRKNLRSGSGRDGSPDRGNHPRSDVQCSPRGEICLTSR